MSTFVLVHGGMIGGNSWKWLIPSLEKKGYKVLSPTLTGLGERKHLSHREVNLETHIQDVVNAIYYAEVEDIILVGHSYGGMVITGVLDQIPEKIQKLIYLAAIIPKNGESMFDAIGKEIASFLEDSLSPNGWEIPPGKAEMYGIHHPETIDWFTKMSSPQPINTFRQKLTLKTNAFQNVKKLYIQCKEDVALDFIASRAKEMGIPSLVLESGHFPMFSHVEELTSLITK